MTRATIAARRLLRRMRPDVVVGAGGYVSVPVVVAALAQRIPVVLLEQNAVPGRATRLLARRARVCRRLLCGDRRASAARQGGAHR